MRETNMLSGLMAGSIAFLVVYLVLAAAVFVLMLVAQWKINRKAGEYGWAAIVPFYGSYVLAKITWGNGWLFLLMFLPIGNLIFSIMTNVKLARAFGKGGGFAVGLILLPVIFLPILGFGSAEYQGPDPRKSKVVFLVIAIVSVLYIAWAIFAGISGANEAGNGLEQGGYDYTYEVEF